MSQLEHINIIKYIDSFFENDYLMIIMEYAEKGDLASLIKNQAEYNN
jgi:serine/threonine protein kinase